MSDLNYECIPLKWDTDYFGINSARVNLDGIIDESGQNEIIDFCKMYDFVTIANLNNLKENNYWIGNRTNAFLADMNIQFVKVMVDKTYYKDENTYVINNLLRKDRIVDIARNSFKYSRFFNDPNLHPNQANNIYLQWTECSFGKKNKYFVVSEREGEIAGYLLFSINEDNSIIELIAVDNKYQGQKVGKSMILTMESFVLDKGINNIKVGTQVNNIEATQFYSTMGYKYVSCNGVYHLWRI